MRLLDLFCGAGGAAVGYSQAGFTDIVGVDIVPQPNYPFTFIQGDALAPPVELDGFDLIHASPPCQAFTKTGWAYRFGYHANHADLIEPTRQLLTGVPYVIENLPGAPVRPDLVLCGSAFGLGVRRHRYFEVASFDVLWSPPCNHSHRVVSPHGNPNAMKGSRREWTVAMEMPWTTTAREVAEAIPPAYTKFIGEQFLAQL